MGVLLVGFKIKTFEIQFSVNPVNEECDFVYDCFYKFLGQTCEIG